MRGTADERAWRRSLACWLYLLLCAHQASSLDLQQVRRKRSCSMRQHLLLPTLTLALALTRRPPPALASCQTSCCRRTCPMSSW